MPGFFEGLKRLVNGEPVFNANDSKNSSGWTDASGNARQSNQPATQQPQAPAGAQAHHSSIIKGQASTFPVVVVKRTRTQVNGTNQAIYCSIVNNFNESVEVEDIELEGGRRQLGGYLRPGEEREWLCYNGPRSRGESHKVATLHYKVHETGDYFRSIYDVEYEFGSDGLYSVEELHFRAPVQDIYG